jgi:lipid II:glycine glycyltransferase (peptidoglycan interpeptide bridge formation enzyme)
MVVTASLGDRPVAAAVFFIMGTRAVYKFGASATESLSLRGNNLVMWEAIRELSRRGVERLDFGRTSKDNEGLRRYKAGFGAAEREIPVCRYDFRARAFVPGRDRAYGWHNRVFRLLPLPLLRLAGRLLYPHLT